MDIDTYIELKEIEDRLFDISNKLKNNTNIEVIWSSLYEYLNAIKPLGLDEE